MRTFIRFCIVVMALFFNTQIARAADVVQDSTGWHRGRGGQVKIQCYQTAKLPPDTLIIVWTDQTEPPQVDVVTRNVLVIIEESVLKHGVAAVMPEEIRWHKSLFGHIEWQRHGRQKTIWQVPTTGIKAIYYAPQNGNRQMIVPKSPERVVPVYQPSLIWPKIPKARRR